MSGRLGWRTALSLVVVLILTGTIPTAIGQQSGPTAVPFHAKRYPFVPEVLVPQRNDSLHNDFCNAFQHALTKDFMGRHRYAWTVFHKPPIERGHWLAMPSDLDGSSLQPKAYHDAIAVDLDRDGRRELLIEVEKSYWQRGWLSSNYLLLVDPKADDPELTQRIDAFGTPQSVGDTTQPLIGVAPYNSIDARFEGTPFRVLRYRNREYLYEFAVGPYGSAGVAKDGTALLSRIHADGTTKLICEVSIATTPATLPLWHARSRPATIPVPQAFVTWVRTIRDIQGYDGSRPARDLAQWSSQTWYDAVIRPWAVVGRPTPWIYGDNDKYVPHELVSRAWIHAWGYGSLSQFRMARAFEQQRREALDELGTYYDQAFGISDGRQAASLAVANVVTESFVIADSIDPHSPRSVLRATKADLTDAPLRQEIAASAKGKKVADPSTLLRSALLIGVPPADIDRLIAAGAELSGSGSGSAHSTDDPEPALFYALEHPDEVQLLLAKGADINEGNSFGKTALMYAAQYDLADTLNILLAHGADVSKTTDPGAVYQLQFDHRTALMYAAENASEAVIDRLIQAGADLCAVDTGKRDIGNYLSRNHRLSAAGHTRFAAMVATARKDGSCVRRGKP